MKYQILSAALGLVLLLGLIPLPPAEANMFLVDDFSDDDDPAESCDLQIVDNSNAPDGSVQTGLSGVIDMVRECVLFLTAFDGQSNAGILVVQASGMFRHMAGTNVETRVMLIYNADGAGLGINVNDSDNFKIGYSKADFAVDVIVRFTDGSGNWAELEDQLEAATVVPKELLFLIQDFIDNPTAVNGVVNLGDIDEIKVTLETTFDVSDYDIDNLMITMQMVGGEMFPVDTTALLLAGAELNAIWLLPAIAAIGIGAFIVSRKRN